MAVRAGVFLADGFEMVEGLTVVDTMRRAGFDVQTISIMPRKMVTSSHQVRIEADILFEEADFTALDAIVLPGGLKGTQNLGAHEGVLSQIRSFAASGKVVGAICAAPTVLSAAGVLSGKQATCYPGCEKDFASDIFYTPEPAVVQENIVTGRSMGQAIPFALALIDRLAGSETAQRVKEAIVY